MTPRKRGSYSQLDKSYGYQWIRGNGGGLDTLPQGVMMTKTLRVRHRQSAMSAEGCLWRVIRGNPSIKCHELAEMLGIPVLRIQRMLTAMKRKGFVVSRDEYGGMWVWDDGDPEG